MAAVLGFEQFGLPTVVFGVALAYSGASLYAMRIWLDRRRAGQLRLRNSLHKKLTGAMLLVLTLDSVGYLVAVQYVVTNDPAVNSALADIFVAVALVTITVGLILPGLISHAVTQIATGARRLATGDLETARSVPQTEYVVVHSAGELGDMALSFNTMQDEAARVGCSRRRS